MLEVELGSGQILLQDPVRLCFTVQVELKSEWVGLGWQEVNCKTIIQYS